MAYEKQNFTDGQVLNAEHLNKMEKGIADVSKILVRNGGDTLKWTAIAEEDIDPALMMGDLFYRISDARVTIGDLANGGRISIPAFGADLDFTAEECFELAPGLVMVTELFVFVGEDNIVLEGAEGEEPLVFTEAGMFTFVDCVLGDFAFTINGYTGFGEEKIHHKYMSYPVFYADLYDGDPYLYKDKGHTEKLTHAELPTSTNFDICVGGMEGGEFLDLYWMRPLTVSGSYVNSAQGFGLVIAQFGERVYTYYTAEYTQPTEATT